MVGNRVDIEAHGAGNMAGEIFGRGVALHGHQVGRAVDHHDVGCAEALRKPISVEQPA
jgi:hypothetical protein